MSLLFNSTTKPYRRSSPKLSEEKTAASAVEDQMDLSDPNPSHTDETNTISTIETEEGSRNPVGGGASEERQQHPSEVTMQPKEGDHSSLSLEESLYCSSAEKVEVQPLKPELAATTLSPQTFDRIRERIIKITERIEIPFRSQPLEVVHAFLQLHNCAAVVFEPILIAKDDGLARIRAALWPSFRHLGAWKRDRILNEVKNDLKEATPHQLFIEATKRLKLQEEDDDIELDIHSSLIVRTLWGCIGQTKGFKHLLNISQQFFSVQAHELHFEYLKFDNKRPLRHVKINADGDCWITSPMTQIKHFSALSQEQLMDSDEEWSGVLTQAEIMKQKKWLAVRIRAQPELLTSWTKCVSKEAEELKAPMIWPKQRQYSMLQALRLEDEYSKMPNEQICALTMLGIPLDSATVLYNIYGNDTQAAVNHYDTEARTTEQPMTRAKKKLMKKKGNE